MLSMTGYVYKNFSKDDITITFEIKCLNHKYLEYNFNFPSNFQKFELDLAKILKDNFSRGKFEINIYLNKFIGNYEILINEELALKVSKELKNLIKKLKISKRIYISNILSFEGMLKIIPLQFSENFNIFILDCFKQSLIELKENMKREGEFLKNELFKYIELINENLNNIKEISINENTILLNKIKEKIKNIVDDKKIDEDRILMEAGVQYTKIDISEEITRLSSHLIYLKNLLNSNEENIGKKLDFISQEILREANTICSKAISTNIIYNSIEIKNNIEKIREQSRNIS